MDNKKIQIVFSFIFWANQVFGHRVSNKVLRKGTTTTSSDSINRRRHLHRFLPAFNRHRQFGFRPANSLARNQNGKSSGQSVLKHWRNRRPPNSSLSRYLKIARLAYVWHTRTYHTQKRTRTCNITKEDEWNWTDDDDDEFLSFFFSFWLFFHLMASNLACQIWFVVVSFLLYCLTLWNALQMDQIQININQRTWHSEREARKHLVVLAPNRRLRLVCHLLPPTRPHPLQHHSLPPTPRTLQPPTPLTCTRPAGTASASKMLRRSATTAPTARP